MEPEILLTPFEEMDIRIIRAKIDAIMKCSEERRSHYNEYLQQLSAKEMEIMERGARRYIQQKQKID